MYRVFNDTLGNATVSSDGETALALGVEIGAYTPHSAGNPDMLTVHVDVSASTREGVNYEWTPAPYGFSWVNVSQTIGISGDNSGQWVDLNFSVLYYGVNYWRLWVCSNGFVSFTDSSSEGVPCSIPNSSMHNGIVAPFWRQLKLSQGGSIKTGHIIDSWSGDNGQRSYQVITWDGIPDSNGHRQTFQLLLEDRQGIYAYHNMMYFQYLSVTNDLQTTIGVQDQIGHHGQSYPLSQISNNSCGGMSTYAYNMGYRLNSLKYTVTKSDSYAAVEPQTTEKEGWNVDLNGSGQHQPNGFWGAVIEAGANALLDLCGAGVVIDALFVAYDISSAAASDEYHAASGTLVPANPSDTQAWGIFYCNTQSAPYDGSYLGRPFDASFANNFIWKFQDGENTQNHTVTVTATACYVNDANQAYMTSTSVTLQMYTGPHYLDVYSDLENSTGVMSYTNATLWVNGVPYTTPVHLILPEASYSLAVATPIYRNSQKFSFYGWAATGGTATNKTWSLTADLNETLKYLLTYTLYISVGAYPPGGGSTNPCGPVDYYCDTNATVTAYPTNSSYVFTYWSLDGSNAGAPDAFTNPRNVTMNSSHNLTAFFSLKSGGGGGEPCPNLLVWNGTFYQSYGVVNIHNPTGEDVTREVSVAKQDVNIANCNAKFTLLEGWPALNFSESSIDQIRLYAVDGFGNRYLCPLISAVHNREGSVLLPLLFSDDWKTQIFLLERIDLIFIAPYPGWLVQSYTFVIEGCNQIKR